MDPALSQKHAKYDAQSADVWALGVILYCLYSEGLLPSFDHKINKTLFKMPDNCSEKMQFMFIKIF